MKQADLGLDLTSRKTRKGKFLDEMERVVPWAALVRIVEPHCPRAKTGRPPFAVETMLRIHYLQQWCARRPNFDHPCRLNIDQGWKPVSFEAGCG